MALHRSNWQTAAQAAGKARLRGRIAPLRQNKTGPPLALLPIEWQKAPAIPPALLQHQDLHRDPHG
jgi:hypothetical protein